MMKTLILFAISFILLLSNSTALEISSPDSLPLNPGEEGTLNIEIENIFDEDVTDLSLRLQFAGLPFIPIGTSEQSIDEIEQDDEEKFVFRIKVASDVVPGDYEIPYTVSYALDDEEFTRTGSLGIVVSSNPDLVFSLDTEMPVIGKEGTITLKIVNKGFYDARFVSVRVLPQGFTLLSGNEVYIGTVDSDDFETATFDVIFNRVGADFNAIVEYKDFENAQITKNINLPLTIYSEERALELGLIEKSNILLYIGIILVLVFLIILWRILRKRSRLRKSARSNNE